MRLTDAVVAAFEDGGIDTAFGLPCEQMDPYYASLADSDLTHVLARSEASAAIMADGYARVNFTAGVADGVGGPGAANLGVGLIEAAGACSPVIAVTGDNDRAKRGREVIQDADNRAILEEHVLASYDPETPDRALERTRDAIREAVTGVPGPTHLNLTEDLIDAEVDRDVPLQPATYPRDRPVPDPDRLGAAAEALDDAERPVILSGEGTLRARAWEAVGDLARTLDAPVVTSMNGKGVLAGDDEHLAGVAGRWGYCEVANDAVAEADAVLVVGARLGELTSVGYTLVPDDATLVHVDLDPAWVGKTHPADVPIVADVRATARALEDRVGGDPGRRERVESLAADRRAWFESFERELESDAVPIKPPRLFREVERALPDDGLVVSATSFTGFFTGAFYRVPRPGVGYIQARGSDGINYCLPQALGAQAAAPDRPVVAVSGDGGIGYHVSELETAVRADLPVTVVVANNQRLGSSKMSQMVSTGTTLSTDFHEGTNYAAVAEGFGVEGQVIEDPDELAPALSEAVGSDDPRLLDVRVDPNSTPPVIVD